MSLIGKLYSITMKRTQGIASFVSLETNDFIHEVGATTTTSVEKIDTVGTPDDMYKVKVAYPNANIPATTQTITDLINIVVAAVDAVYGVLEGRVVPGAPTIGTTTRVAAAVTASVAFTAPASNGGNAITSYTVVSTPGNLTATGAASPIVVSGLTPATTYTFKVKATNGVGSSNFSAASNAVA